MMFLPKTTSLSGPRFRGTLGKVRWELHVALKPSPVRRSHCRRGKSINGPSSHQATSIHQGIYDTLIYLVYCHATQFIHYPRVFSPGCSTDLGDSPTACGSNFRSTKQSAPSQHHTTKSHNSIIIRQIHLTKYIYIYIYATLCD